MHLFEVANNKIEVKPPRAWRLGASFPKIFAFGERLLAQVHSSPSTETRGILNLVLKFPIKAELHCHSNRKLRLFYCPLLYDSIQTEQEILNECVKKNIKILAITDHDSLDGYRTAKKIIQEKNLDIILIPACEVSAKEEHILAYNIKREIKKELPAREVIKEIHRQGGIAIAAHPFRFLSMGEKVFDVNFDAIEGFNASIPHTANKKAQEAALKLRKPAFSGSDAHQVETIGSGLMMFSSSTTNVEKVLEKLKSGEFATISKPIKPLPMIIRHVIGNIKLQFKELFNYAKS